MEIHLLLVPSHNTWPHLEFSMQAHPNTEALPIFVSFWSSWILCWDGIIRRTGAFRFSMEGCPLQGAQRDAYTRLDGASCPCPNFMRPHYVLFRFCFFFFALVLFFHVWRWFHYCYTHLFWFHCSLLYACFSFATKTVDYDMKISAERN